MLIKPLKKERVLKVEALKEITSKRSQRDLTYHTRYRMEIWGVLIYVLVPQRNSADAVCQVGRCLNWWMSRSSVATIIKAPCTCEFQCGLSSLPPCQVLRGCHSSKTDSVAVPWLLPALHEKWHTALVPTVQWPQPTQKGLGLDSSQKPRQGQGCEFVWEASQEAPEESEETKQHEWADNCRGHPGLSSAWNFLGDWVEHAQGLYCRGSRKLCYVSTWSLPLVVEGCCWD